MGDRLTVAGAVAGVAAVAVVAHLATRTSPHLVHHAAGGGLVTDRFVRGPHRDYLIVEEGPERLHLGDGGGWVEPLLPPVGRRGRVIRYAKTPDGWHVSFQDGPDCVGEGRARTKSGALDQALRDAGVRGLARGGRVTAPPARPVPPAGRDREHTAAHQAGHVALATASALPLPTPVKATAALLNAVDHNEHGKHREARRQRSAA